MSCFRELHSLWNEGCPATAQEMDLLHLWHFHGKWRQMVQMAALDHMLLVCSVDSSFVCVCKSALVSPPAHLKDELALLLILVCCISLYFP